MEHLAKLAQSFKEHSAIIESLKNDEGLVPAVEMIFEPRRGSYALTLRRYPKVGVFPHIQLSAVVPLLARDTTLWSNSAFEVSAMPSITARIPIFGVPLGRALSEVIKRGLQKSRYALPAGTYDPQGGFAADLLVFVGLNLQSSPDLREIQVWEDVRGSTEVFYAHSIVSVSSMTVRHLDGATIHFSDDQKDELFNKGRKLKGQSYKKHFRIDGSFDLSLGIDLMKAYFPIEELTTEALEM
jgi:hypothetical protein